MRSFIFASCFLACTNLYSQEINVNDYSCPSLNDSAKIVCLYEMNLKLDSILSEYNSNQLNKLKEDSSKTVYINNYDLWKSEIEKKSIEIANKNPDYNFELVRLTYINEQYRKKLFVEKFKSEPNAGCPIKRSDTTGNHQFEILQGKLLPPLIKYDETKNNNDYSSIEFHGDTLQEVYASAYGEVKKIISIGSSKAVVLQHGNYMTIYGNLETVAVKQKQIVNHKELLGTIRTDSYGTYVIFEIWEDTSRLNPLDWLDIPKK